MLFFDNVDSKYHLLIFIGIVIFMIIMAVLLSISFNKNISDSESETTSEGYGGMSIFIMVLMILFMIGSIVSNRNNMVKILGYEVNKGMVIYIFIAFMIMFSSKMNQL